MRRFGAVFVLLVFTSAGAAAQSLTMSVERGPAPPPPVGGGRGGQAPAIPGTFTILVVGK